MEDSSNAPDIYGILFLFMMFGFKYISNNFKVLLIFLVLWLHLLGTGIFNPS